MNTKMNVYSDKRKMLIWIPAHDIEMTILYNTQFADPDADRAWTGDYLLYRCGDEAFAITATDLFGLLAVLDHPAARIIRAVRRAEQEAARGIPQAVAYGGKNHVLCGPIGLARKGETWVEFRDGLGGIWHNEGL